MGGYHDACAVGSMAVAIGQNLVIIYKVPAMSIINIPVPIIVNQIPGSFTNILPDLTAQLGMDNIHTSIDDRHDNIITGT